GRFRWNAPSCGTRFQWYIKLDGYALWCVGREVNASVKLSEQALDHLEAQTCPGLVDIEILRKADSAVGHLHMQVGAPPFARYLNFAGPAGVGMLGCIRHKLVDQKPQRDCLVCRNHQVAESAAYRVRNCFLQLTAKLAGEVGDVDESDLGAAPKMVVNLGNGGDARSCVVEGILNFLRLRAAALHAEQPHVRCEAVLDPVAHLSRQHGLVVEGFAEIGVGMLALDGDAEQPGEAGKEVRIRNVELAGLRAIDFEDAERQVVFAATCDQDVDGAPDPVIRQQLWRSKPRFLLEVVGNDHLSGLESVAGRRFQVDAKRHLANHARCPPDARTHQQPFVIGHILQDFGERGFEALRAELRRALQDLSDVTRLQCRTAELAQKGLLAQSVRKLLPGGVGRSGRGRCRLFPGWSWHAIVPSIEVAALAVRKRSTMPLRWQGFPGAEPSSHAAGLSAGGTMHPSAYLSHGKGRFWTASAVSRPVVLIVEDESLLRISGAGMVAEAGFDVVEAGNADEANRHPRSAPRYPYRLHRHTDAGIDGR